MCNKNALRLVHMVGYSISQSVQYVVTSNTPVTEKVKNALKTSVLKLMHIAFYQLLYQIHSILISNSKHENRLVYSNSSLVHTVF